MYKFHLDNYIRLKSDKPILSARMFKGDEGEHIIFMIHDENRYTMQVAHLAEKENSYDELVDRFYEDIKKYYNNFKGAI